MYDSMDIPKIEFVSQDQVQDTAKLAKDNVQEQCLFLFLEHTRNYNKFTTAVVCASLTCTCKR